jgi:hypothetical protein
MAILLILLALLSLVLCDVDERTVDGERVLYVHGEFRNTGADPVEVREVVVELWTRRRRVATAPARFWPKRLEFMETTTFEAYLPSQRYHRVVVVWRERALREWKRQAIK